MFRIALKYGILIVFFIFLWGIIEYMAGIEADFIQYHPVLTLLSLSIPMIFMYFGIREAQKSSVGYFSYGQAFKTGILITLVVAVLDPLGQWIYFSFIRPDFFESMKAFSEARLLAQGIDPEVARRQATEESTMGSYLLNRFIGAVVAGVIISSILAIFVRDKMLPKGG